LNAGGTFNQTGGSFDFTTFNHNAGNASFTELYLGRNAGASSTYNLSGGSLFAANEYVGNAGNGTFLQTGGTSIISTALYLGFSAGASGSYNLSGGSLSATDTPSYSYEYVGYSGTGTFTQSAGTNSHKNNIYFMDDGVLGLGWNNGSSGTYNLSGGSLSTGNSATEYVGYSGSGSFTQTGGTNNASGGFDVGVNSGSSGTYQLQGGSLTTQGEYIGHSGSGAFAQTGGTNNLGNGQLYLGVNSGSSGTYTLGGGSGSPVLAAGTEYVGYYDAGGSFTQSGGTNTVSTLYLATNSGSSGTYNLQGGSLSAAAVSLYVGGLFNQNGGSLNATTFTQSGGTVTGALQNYGAFNYTSGTFSGRLLNYGTLSLGSNFTAGNGLLHNSATTLAIASGQTVTLNGAGLTDERTMTLAGTLAATNEIIGDAGTSASFTQTGGTNTASGALTLANQSGSSGPITSRAAASARPLST
jgi:hypothetical protein